ncbi:MAG: hypothetical protein ABJF11_09010 [Reichenbachiella sp.]|uniref:hypothetical protein n=1 Tax=Reichenbachiella sp. TaxID=2184521 RepID=UPI00326332A1
MNAGDQKSLFENLNQLVVSNGNLTETNRKAFDMVEQGIRDKKNLMIACHEIYEGLGLKEKRSLAEESWYQGLKQILRQSF